ncbi:MAG: DUF6439 family protein [Cyanobacteriota bacterium]|nr:DUF6439 family protein [Cyanobacteriota bacterium]
MRVTRVACPGVIEPSPATSFPTTSFPATASREPAPPGTLDGASPGGGTSREWPPEALALAQRLQQSLTIDDRQWHRLKSQRPRRAAEQLAAALVQLLAADSPASPTSSRAREDACALVEHALGWLRSEISDPGCPSHGR